MKQIPSDPTKVSQVTGLFLGDTFFDMLCEETNLYYLQNQEKYVTCSKGLKWSDVTVAEMKKFFSIIILMGQVRKDKGLLVYVSIFRYSYFQETYEL